MPDNTRTNNNDDAGDDVGSRQGAADVNADGREVWPPWAAGAVESMRQIPSISRAAKTVGVNRSTIQRFIQRDEAFKLAISDAREEALDTLEEVMLLRARQGQPTKKTVTRTYPDGKGGMVTETTVTDDAHLSDNLGMFYLKRWRPEYRESYRVEQSGPNGGPIKFEGTLDAAVERFRAEVVRLAAERGTADAS